ncbi:hypothetical protein [Arthrobacter alpinus]|uniref:hypothetical protein n=1 Tax=Arthrobacter alpinus TaxID=656366 RepID=UPI0012FF2410|nr:hypothetical protein [Arthrobacter alpinus]
MTGRDGSGAVQIATSTTTSRGFLSQDASIPSTAKKLRLTFWQKKGTLTGTGKAGIRVTFPGLPTQYLGLDAATAWRQVSGYLDVPAGATTVRIEPMVDTLQGSMQIDDINLSAYDAASNLSTNGGFESFSGTVPDNWSSWNPAGTGTISNTAGFAGANALRITSDTPASRLAVTQDITLPPGGGTFAVDFFSRIAAITGSGKAGIRIDVLDGGGGTTFIGRNTPTNGWEKSSGLITVPTAATKIRVLAFNDTVQATMDLDEIHVSPSTSSAALTAAATAAGGIGLNWVVTAPTGTPASFEIHRGPDGSAVASDASTLIRTVPASLTRATDQEWLPATNYKYLVIAKDSAGHEVARTNESSFRSAATEPTATSYLSVTSQTAGAHLGWRAKANAPLPLKVVSSSEPVTAVNVSAATDAATNLARFGGASAPAQAAYFALVDANGGIQATASTAELAHPRIGLNAESLAKIHRIIETTGTPQDAWNTIKARVDAGMVAFPSTPDRYAREAAFVYEITGDTHYAGLTFDAFTASASAAPFTAEQELNTANPVSQLAVAYDWAYNGWSDAQRAYAQDFFERTSVFFEFANHPNLTMPDKASNWIAVVRGAELAQDLAVRGDGSYGMRDARIGTLIDQLRQHLDAAHSDGGWFQEGPDYLDYTEMMSLPGILGSFDAGIDALRSSWTTPDTTNLLLHTVSLRQPADRLQWGVGYATSTTALPLYLNQAKSGELAPLVKLMDQTEGHDATKPTYSPGFVTQGLIDWPESYPAGQQYDPAKVYPALLDNEVGSYSFRNRLVDANDVLVQLNNRNHSHVGWTGYETFGISLIGHDAHWAMQPGKHQDVASQYSRVMVDNKTTQAIGNGKTLGSHAYDGQGGGYVSLDGSGNYQVATATREAAVDMTGRGDTNTLLAFHDRFADTVSHSWAWQLAPEAGITVDFQNVGDNLQFTFHKGDSYLRGWLLNAAGATAAFTDGSFRITRTGTSADFDIVMALGKGTTIPTATTTSSQVSVAGTTIDTAKLNDYTPAPSAKTAQTVTFGSLPAKTYGDPDFTVNAAASSNLPVAFAGTGACTVDGATVHLTGAGDCTVTASQAGDGSFALADPVVQTFTVAKAAQTVNFATLPAKTYADPDFTVSAAASSNLPVAFAGSGACTVDGATVHLTGAGDCTVTASQAGDGSFALADPVVQTFTVSKAAQTVSFAALPAKTYGDPDFTVSAAASSTLPATVVGSGACTVTGTTVHLISAGSCTITASQVGGANYLAAPAVAATFSVGSPLLDNFDGINGHVGGTWTGQSSALSYLLNNKTLRPVLGGALIWNDTFGPDQEASVKFTTIGVGSPSQGVLLKSQSTKSVLSGAISVVYDASAKGVRVSTLGTNKDLWHPYSNVAAPFTAGDVLRARYEKGVVTVYRNAALVATVPLSAVDAQFFAGKTGQVGIWSLLAVQTALDDFRGATVTQ